MLKLIQPYTGIQLFYRHKRIDASHFSGPGGHDYSEISDYGSVKIPIGFRLYKNGICMRLQITFNAVGFVSGSNRYYSYYPHGGILWTSTIEGSFKKSFLIDEYYQSKYLLSTIDLRVGYYLGRRAKK